MYFVHLLFSFKYHCFNYEKILGLGDIVLIKKPTEKPPQQRITHEVMKIIFKFGYIIDPVTKKRVVRDSFDDEFEFRTRVVKEILEKPFDQVFLFLVSLLQFSFQR